MEKKAERIHKLFNVTNSGVRQDWEVVAQEAHDFYLDNQISENEHKALVDQGMPTFTVNRIIPIVEMLVFYATAQSPRWQAVGVDGSDSDIAALFADLSAYIWDLSSGDALFANIVTDAVTKGVGYFCVQVDPDLDRGMGEVILKQPEPFDVFVDQKSRDPLLRDAGHIIIRKLLPKNHLQRLLPQYERKIKNAESQFFGETSFSSKEKKFKNDFQYKDIFESYNQEGESDELIEFYECFEKVRIPYVQVWTRQEPKQEEIDQIAKGIEQQMKEIKKEKDVEMKEFTLKIQQQTEAGGMIEERAVLEVEKAQQKMEQEMQMMQQQMINEAMESVTVEENYTLTKKEFDMMMKHPTFKEIVVKSVQFYNTQVRQTCVAGDKFLYQYDLPTSEYPIIPVYYKWTGTPFPMSAVAPLVGKQREMNKAHQLLIHNASLGSSLRWLYYDGSIDIKHWEQNAAAPGALLPIHSGFEPPKEMAPMPLNNAFFSVIEQGKKDMEYLAGIYSSMQGDTGTQHETYKGLLAQDEYGTRRIKAWMQNGLEPSLKQVGEVVKQYSQAVYSAEKVFRIVDPDDNEQQKEVKMNIPTYNEFGDVIGRFNDYATAKFDVRIVAGSTMPVNRWAYLAELKELMQLGVVDDVAVLAEADIRNKDKIIQRKSMISQLKSAMENAEDKIKDLNGTIETLERQLVQAGIKDKVRTAEHEMNKSVLQNKANVEDNRRKMAQSERSLEQDMTVTKREFSKDLERVLSQQKDANQIAQKERKLEKKEDKIKQKSTESKKKVDKN